MLKISKIFEWHNVGNPFGKQIKCSIKKYFTMKSFSILLLAILLVSGVKAQVTYDTTHSHNWNSEARTWEFFERIISSYNNGQLTAELSQIYDNDGWINYHFKAFYYNNGRVIEEFEQYWNDAKLKWEDNYRKLYHYNSTGQLIEITHQNVFDGNYINSSKEILEYSADGKLIQKTTQMFEESWSNFLRYQYYYNANDLLIEENLTFWMTGGWESNGFTVKNYYNNKGELAEKVKVKKSGMKELNINKEEFYYGGNGRLEEHIVSNWNNKAGQWVNKDKAMYVNNLNGYVLSKLSQSSKNDEWINYFFTEFTGKQSHPAGVNISDGMTFSVYPTNFGKNATIEFTNPYREIYHVRVVDYKGQLIGSATTDKQEISIDARNLDKGLYFVELQGSNLYSGKFSIE
jgi:hypothetical protein